jgi:thiol-disulfide isomerase/thioredoxin
MKNLFTNLFIFIALSIAFSSFTACKTSVSSQKAANGDVSTNNAAPTTNSEVAGNYPTAPDAVLQTENKDLDGNPLRIGDYKGKVVLVNLWATWCGPCRGEMPHFIEMQDKYRDQGFEVIGLDVDEESVEEINAFAKQMKLNYKLGYADQKLVSAFIKITKLQGIPQTLLINREGQLIGVFSGGGQKVITQMKEAVDKAMVNS